MVELWGGLNPILNLSVAGFIERVGYGSITVLSSWVRADTSVFIKAY